MPLHEIRRLINAATELGTLREKTRKLEQLQQAYVDCFPAEFAGLTQASRVGYIKGGALYVLADNAGTAAKLRHLLPRLAPLLGELGAEVSGIKVAVQVRNPLITQRARSTKKLLPVDSIEKFRKLAQQVRDPELKLAITNLVEKRRNTKISG